MEKVSRWKEITASPGLGPGQAVPEGAWAEAVQTQTAVSTTVTVRSRTAHADTAAALLGCEGFSTGRFLVWWVRGIVTLGLWGVPERSPVLGDAGLCC